MKFVDGFKKMAALTSSQLDRAGLAALAIPSAIHTVKSIKEKKPGEAAMGATELGGLGLLYRAVQKAHP